MDNPIFPNGFTSWIETYYEVVEKLTLMIASGDDNLATGTADYQGSGGLYELAETMTNEFEKLHLGREWDGEFFDEIEKFIDEANTDFIYDRRINQ